MIRATRLGLGLGIAMIVVLGATSVAHAQYYQAPPPGYYAPPPRYGYPPPPPPPPRGMYRQGIIFGVALGAGSTSAQNCGDICGASGAFQFDIGGMLNPRTALEFDFWLDAHGIPNTDANSVHSLYTAAIQYWPSDIFWLKGGIGGANMHISSAVDGYTYTNENGLGLTLGAGLEFLQIGNFALDGQFRFGHGFFDLGGDVNAWALLIGANWY
jgi:hypothetical protein